MISISPEHDAQMRAIEESIARERGSKLERIKAALRESIELADKATPGPWEVDKATTWDQSIAVQPCVFQRNAWTSNEDAAFIAHARTMTPLACKALLTAIEGLEQALNGIGNTDDRMSDENSFIVNSIGDLVEKALSSITSEWPDV